MGTIIGDYLKETGQSQQQQRPQQAAVQQKQKKGGIQGLLESFLPTIGGTGGALGGAALGASLGSVVPGIGTAIGGLAGAVLGGAGGSAVGKVGQNYAEGEDLGKDVGSEALLGGITSTPLTGGLKLAKAGVKAATGIGEANARQALQEAGQLAIPKLAGGLQKKAGQEVADTIASRTASATPITDASSQSILSRLGGSLQDKSSDLMATQSNLTRSQARQLGVIPKDTFGNINARTGLSNMDDMAQLSSNLTGSKDGILDTLTRAAVDSAPGIKVDGILKTADDLLTKSGSLLSNQERKQILNNAKNAHTSMFDGGTGMLANPGSALDQANSFRANARDLTAGFSATAADKQKAKIYNGLAKKIEDSIYDAPEIGSSLPTIVKAGRDDVLFKAQDARSAGNEALAKAYEGVAKELSGVTDIKGLRTMKKDFVDLSKIDKATAQAQNGAGAQVGDQMQGAGRILQKPSNILALPLNAATPSIAGKMAEVGGKLQAGENPTNILSKIASGQKGKAIVEPGAVDAFAGKTTGQGLVGAATRESLLGQRPGGIDSAQEDPNAAIDPTLDPTADPSLQDPTLQGGIPEATLAADQAPTEDSNNIFSKENIQQLILQDMAGNKGQNVSTLLNLYKTFQEEKDTKAEKLNSTTQKALAQSANGEATIAQLQSLLGKAGGGQGVFGNIANTLGDVGLNNNAKTYNDLSRGSVAQIAKALGETGALSDSDIATYSAMLPKITDTSEVANNKLAALRQRLQTASQNTAMYGTGEPDLTSLLAQ